VWQDALRGFSVSTSDVNARGIVADPRVDLVVPDTEVQTTATQNVAWGPGNLDRIDDPTGEFDSAYSYLGSAGRDVHAYVIDTGIRITHADFGGRAAWGVNTIDTQNTDCNGHGTMSPARLAAVTGEWPSRCGWSPSRCWVRPRRPHCELGASTDIPVPGDYNGDGRTDRAVFRPSTGQWLMHGIGTTAWGQNGDIPLAS
jgi:subtilisin family serine protease